MKKFLEKIKKIFHENQVCSNRVCPIFMMVTDQASGFEILMSQLEEMSMEVTLGYI